MGTEPRIPALDIARTASALVRGAEGSTAGDEVRIPVSADEVRWLSRKRASVALGALPLFLFLGGGALVISLNLALVAVISGFFAYACVSIARRQRDVAREAVDFEVVVMGNQLHVPGRAPRPIVKAIDRPDYMRLLATDARIVALWLDNRRDPSASFDLPTSRQSRRALCGSLRAAGIEVATEGAAQRIVVLAGSVAVGVFGLTAARVLLGLTATTLVQSPTSWAILGGIVIVAWLSQRRRE